jgi:chloramphenicol O-acetyltransferase type A
MTSGPDARPGAFPRSTTFFITWLDFTSIQHPVGRFKSNDIPSLAWGKISELGNGKISLPFSVQAHHGFVDGYHVHLLSEQIKRSLKDQ